MGAAGAMMAAVAAVFWYTAGGPRDYADLAVDVTDRALVAEGRGLYAEMCASCHGARLEGQPNWKQPLADGTLPAPPHDESGHTWHHPDAMLFSTTKYGGQAFAPAGFTSAMPGFEDQLNDREIIATLAYIKSRWSPEIRFRQEQINRRYRDQNG